MLRGLTGGFMIGGSALIWSAGIRRMHWAGLSSLCRYQYFLYLEVSKGLAIDAQRITEGFKVCQGK